MTTALYKKTLYILFGAMLCLNFFLWVSVRDVKARWTNVPPAPSIAGALTASLGDKHLAYRVYAMMIQNLGNTGGLETNLGAYNFDRLKEWLMLENALDPRPDIVPFLAANLYAAAKSTTEFRPLVEYLDVASGDGQGQKWRWLARAVYIARYKMEDLDLALPLANKLAALPNPDMPLWARQMPAYIMTARGEKQAAYELMVSMLHSSARDLQPNEVNATLDYICTRILDKEEAAQNKLCDYLKE